MASHASLDAYSPGFLALEELFSFYLSRYACATALGALFMLKNMAMPFILYQESATNVLTRANGRETFSGSDKRAVVHAQLVYGSFLILP